MKRVILIFLVLLMSVMYSSRLQAQDRTVSGRVTSADDGTALPGVNVSVKGTTSGTATNAEGDYTLSVPSDATLVFSFIGLTSQEVPVGNRSVINVQMASDIKSLNEVVVIGYGSQQKKDLTGNIASVSGASIANIPVSSVEESLQGRAAGVYINSGSGKLGQGVQIRVRGAASVSAGNQPLYVVDGIPITSSDLGSANSELANPIADLNPNDIESIEILKDASAAAIYGSRASNGVVLITTKKGRIGKTKIDLGYFTGVSTPTRTREWLNAAEYIELFSEAAENEGYDPQEEFEGNGLPWNSTDDTDWASEAFQTGGISQYNLSLSGGNEKTRFFLSGTHNDQKGIIVANEFKRSSARINLDHSINQKFRIGTNISLIRSVNYRVPDDNAFSNPLQLVALPPIQPKIDPATGELNRNTLYYNNLIELSNATNVATTYRTISNIFASYDIVPGLTFRTEYGIDFLALDEDIYRGRITEDGGPTGYGYSNQVRSFNYTTNNTLNYNKIFNDVHTLDLLGGISYQEANVRGTSVEGRGFPNDNFQRIASAARITSGSSNETGYSFLSYLARANYKFMDKYLFALSGRIDGSSRFGQNNRYGFFPAASAGWILSEESFMQNSNVLSFLKLRASYGLTGNSEIGNFQSRGLYNAIFYADQAGITPSTIASPDLRWENTAQTDIGIDFGFFNNRISGELDYYIKTTRDLLLDVPLPAINGFTSITKNIGSLENKGIEFVLNTQNLVGEFKWTTNFNISRNRNKVLELNGDPIEGGGRLIGRVAEGEPLGYFYTVKYAGVDPANGDALYYDLEGNKTSEYSSNYRQKVGDPNPDFIGGMTNTFSYKGFDLNVLTQFVYGNDLYNVAGYFQSVNADYFDNQSRDQLKRWQKEGDITDVPQARLYAGNGSGTSSRWVQDGSFLRIRTVTFGYNLPTDLIKRVYLQNARIYVTGQNLFTFTKYEGYDPEVNSTYFQGTTAQSTNINLGHDFYTPPQQKTITVGINLGF
ncbi:TonB-dependent receptor [Rhodocytophaga aerolata]|uniref:TonB-dependent receptor n=1 Tax=Rhodocytophaga aerolata TaxID=455078 RepID=A0ABT8R230_9BACT|nr:TonB-dependent receptor [Rhodocytophaga aerolata]MDO1445358.1 TonB-dependent receptor [Rhodocytophaga aerolata]